MFPLNFLRISFEVFVSGLCLVQSYDFKLEMPLVTQFFYIHKQLLKIFREFAWAEVGTISRNILLQWNNIMAPKVQIMVELHSNPGLWHNEYDSTKWI